MSQNVMGYFAPPPAPVAPVAPPPPPSPYGAAGPVPTAPYGAYSTTPTVPGQQPVATWDTWVPTSQADPYVAGMRTSASGLAALTGAAKAATNAKWGAMMAARKGAGLAKASKTLMAAGRNAASKEAYMSGKMAIGGAKTAVKSPGIVGAFRHTFLSVGNIARAIGGAAIVAIPLSLITNFLDFQAGKITEQQRNALIVADIGGYTVTGASASLIGGFVGTTFLGPMVGTVVGVAAGFGLGWVYEKFIRPRWGEMVRNALYAQPTPPPVVTPPVDPYPLPK